MKKNINKKINPSPEELIFLINNFLISESLFPNIGGNHPTKQEIRNMWEKIKQSNIQTNKEPRIRYKQLNSDFWKNVVDRKNNFKKKLMELNHSERMDFFFRNTI